MSWYQSDYLTASSPIEISVAMNACFMSMSVVIFPQPYTIPTNDIASSWYPLKYSCQSKRLIRFCSLLLEWCYDINLIIYPLQPEWNFYGIIGVRIARGTAEHKMARLHYVMATVEEAKATYRSHHSDNKWKPGESSNWYASHTPAGHSTFEQFRNGHDFNM